MSIRFRKGFRTQCHERVIGIFHGDDERNLINQTSSSNSWRCNLINRTESLSHSASNSKSKNSRSINQTCNLIDQTWNFAQENRKPHFPDSLPAPVSTHTAFNLLVFLQDATILPTLIVPFPSTLVRPRKRRACIWINGK
jgi:hypothetical protein